MNHSTKNAQKRQLTRKENTVPVAKFLYIHQSNAFRLLLCHSPMRIPTYSLHGVLLCWDEQLHSKMCMLMSDAVDIRKHFLSKTQRWSAKLGSYPWITEGMCITEMTEVLIDHRFFRFEFWDDLQFDKKKKEKFLR